MAHLKSKHVGDPYDLYSVLRHNQGLKHQYNWDICLHRDCSSATVSVHVGNWSACLPCLVQSISGSEALPPGSFVATLYPSKYDSNARQQQRFLTLSELELLLDEPSVFAAILHAANQIARHKDLIIGESDSIIQNIRKAYSLLMENSALRALLD